MENDGDYEVPIPEHLRTDKSFRERADNWLAALPYLLDELKETKGGKSNEAIP